jgi:cell wall-associated NlpC family hydrolase
MKEIVNIARKYVGTPFVHQGRSPHGVDCLGLLIMVANELNLHGRDGLPLVAHDNLNYSRNPDTENLLNKLCACLTPKITPEIGDIGLFKIDGNAQHLAIISDYNNDNLGLIHAYQNVNAVVEHNFSQNWKNRLVQLFLIF